MSIGLPTMVRKMVLAGFLKRRQWRFLWTHVRSSAHPLQTNGDLSSLPHLCSTNAGQCGLHWRQNLHSLFPS